MFLLVSVILLTGGSPENPPRTRQTPPGPGRHHSPGPGKPPTWIRQTPPPWDQADTPHGPGRQPQPPQQGEPPLTRQTPPSRATTPPHPGRRLQHTVNERPVRIPLECILVTMCLYLIASPWLYCTCGELLINQWHMMKQHVYLTVLNTCTCDAPKTYQHDQWPKHRAQNITLWEW